MKTCIDDITSSLGVGPEKLNYETSLCSYIFFVSDMRSRWILFNFRTHSCESKMSSYPSNMAAVTQLQELFCEAALYLNDILKLHKLKLYLAVLHKQ